MIGFIKLHRDIQGTWIHKDPVYFKAYCDILLNVNWEEKTVLIGHNALKCKAGEALFSLETWAKKFGGDWNKNKVRRFFSKLERGNAIRTESERNTTRLILVNMAYTEPEGNGEGTEEEQKPTPTKEERRKNTIPELKNIEIPSNWDNELIDTFSLFIQMRKQIKKPYKSQISIQTKMNSLSKQIDQFGKTAVLDAITLSLENQYQGIKVSWLKDGSKTQPKEVDIMDYYKAKLTPEKYTWLKSGKHKYKNRTPYIEIIEADWKKNKQLYIDEAAKFKNKTVTPAFLCDICKGILSYTIGGANPKSTISFFTQWYNKQANSFNIDAIDIRPKVINEYKYKNQTQLANFI